MLSYEEAIENAVTHIDLAGSTKSTYLVLRQLLIKDYF